MAGPNGSGKSSVFDAFSVWQQTNHHGGLHWDTTYHSRDSTSTQWNNQVQIEFHTPTSGKRTFYLRSAHRNDPEFQLQQLSKQSNPTEQMRVRRMIETDSAVSQNYQQIASAAFEDAFDRMDETQTLKEFREAAIGEIGAAVSRLFPDLKLETLGNPLEDGTFHFTKGTATGFSYKNLSGGEKAAFDLLLDMIVKRRKFDDTVFGIDEPESHMNTRLQGALLDELYQLVPAGSQLWVSTHSIGMMRKARELYKQHPDQVIFLDFEGHDYDKPVVMSAVAPTRAFWERILRVALDDLSELVAPSEIVLCEGNPKGPIPSKNEEHDARCYECIFGEEFPDTKFISAGNSKEVSGDRLQFAVAFSKIIKGIKVRRLIDRDDHSLYDAAEFKKKGVWTLSERHLESYLYDEEVLTALYQQKGSLDKFTELQLARQKALSDSHARGYPIDDVKSAAPQIFDFVRRHLNMTAAGNDQMAFARNVLAPLIRPGMKVYAKLKMDIGL
jgi:predicted ATPase